MENLERKLQPDSSPPLSPDAKPTREQFSPNKEMSPPKNEATAMMNNINLQQHQGVIIPPHNNHESPPQTNNGRIKFSIDEILKKVDKPTSPPLIRIQSPKFEVPIPEHRYVPLSVPHYYPESDDSMDQDDHHHHCGGKVQDSMDDGTSITFVQNSDDEDDDCVDPGDNEQSGEGYSWLHCTRYKPPKLPRSKRKDTTKKRKLGRNPRVPFTQHQVSVLEQKFRQTHYLSSVDVAELSATLNLTETRVKIWFQNRRARERRDKNSPPVLEKELSAATSHPHYNDHIPDPASPTGENRLLGKFPSTEEQFKAMGNNPYNVGVLQTPWGNMYHTVHGLFGLRPLGVQYYDSQQQRALAQHRMLALQRHSAFTPVVNGVNGVTRSLPAND